MLLLLYFYEKFMVTYRVFKILCSIFMSVVAHFHYVLSILTFLAGGLEGLERNTLFVASALYLFSLRQIKLTLSLKGQDSEKSLGEKVPQTLHIVTS